MGLWDKLVKAKNYFTGGGAEVVLEFVDEPQLRRPFKVQLFVRVKETDIEIDRICLVIKNLEEVVIKNVKVNRTTPGAGSTQPGSVNKANDHKTVRESHVITKAEIVLDENVLLHANQEYDWQYEVQLPIDGVNGYAGKYTKIYWTIQAYLEKAGNDPNSKLITFDPRYEIS
ncbi:MAG: hypothetical protein AAFO94_08925 [Bacteroidota bacterium]